ncbi:protein of unknown function [Magnetospirillum gryphiswaldense MSR-1 v2]|uniref:Methyltransferase domain-containing protein n=1 Tax=Magnetospirillum gryphiswaldense (strain DSM 6361 / JCM 21280 / NBRC 15271 / MSR-1) TaxID=431944 RepID=V6F8A3_MAGGM|nr:class I SAM-dependent methyltransferase [Magnetospirillum gryphiswaldense]CDL00641.1 protein of unknown function [Magnetospirillum gryphiswaldense MSR-1 v2]
MSLQPHVANPLVLTKSISLCVKAAIKNAMLAAGWSWRHWDRVHAYVPRPDSDRLTPQQVADITLYSINFFERVKTDLEERSVDQRLNTCEYQAIPLVRHVLDTARLTGRVLNIGCGFPLIECAEAAKNSDSFWINLDFVPDLADRCAAIARPNTRFVSGYPLDWIERTDEKMFDVALFNRVAVLLTPGELRSYLKALARVARHVVLCEPACINRYPRPVNVDTIPSERPLPLYGTMHVHNYRSLLAEAGFDLLHYTAAPTPIEWHGEEHHLIQAIARNTSHA